MGTRTLVTVTRRTQVTVFAGPPVALSGTAPTGAFVGARVTSGAAGGATQSARGVATVVTGLDATMLSAWCRNHHDDGT